MSEHPRAGLAAWILIALAGLAIAVALSVAASNLSTQPIGLEGEPLRAGEKLAPATTGSSGPSESPTRTTSTDRTSTQRTSTQTTQTPAPTQTSPTTPLGDSTGPHDYDHDSDDD